MSKSLAQVNVTDNFQIWLERTNDLVSELQTSILTASVIGSDETIGNATLTGVFTSSSLVANTSISDTLRILTVENRTDITSNINFLSPANITSSAQKVLTIKSSSQPTRFSITNNANLSWELGSQTSVSSSGFIVQVEGSANPQFRLLQTGILEIRTPTGVRGSIDANMSGNAETATRLETARLIGGVSFNGSANINLPGVNIPGNQSTSGSAATLTTPRLIGGVSFNGSANINLPGVNIPGNQSTSGSAATLTTARNINGTAFNGSTNITTATWGAARTIWGQSINGSGDVTAPLRPAAGSLSAPAFSTSGDTNTGMYFSSPDTVNITTGGSLAATFSSTGNFTAVGNVTAFSDARLKTNIRTIDNALSKVKQMRGVYFDKDGNAGVGVIAQEIEKVLPEVVLNDEYKSVAYGNIIGVLIEAIKELEHEINKLKDQK
jgi:hypothetical protein